MYKLIFLMSKYVCVLSLTLSCYFALAGPVAYLSLTGATCAVAFACTAFFSTAMRVNKERTTFMHDTGDNDFDKNVVEEDEGREYD